MCSAWYWQGCQVISMIPTDLRLKLHLSQSDSFDLLPGGDGGLLLPLDHVDVLLQSVSVVVK